MLCQQKELITMQHVTTLKLNDSDFIALLELLDEAKVAFVQRQSDYALKRDNKMASYMSAKYDEAKKIQEFLHNKFMSAK